MFNSIRVLLHCHYPQKITTRKLGIVTRWKVFSVSDHHGSIYRREDNKIKT